MSFPSNPNNDLAQCSEDIAVVLDSLDVCLANPLLGDADLDGEPDPLDACSATLPGNPVDQSGCSLNQFCSSIGVTTMAGKRACNLVDWRNDEPTGNARDCQVVGAECVPVAGVCGIGFELALLLPPLMWLYGRRVRSIH